MAVSPTAEQERLIHIIRRFPQRRILVVGDAVADQFIYGAISRVSREAPVFILRHEHTETTPGGAANCAMNLATLGAKVALVSVTGEDEAGRALIEKLTAAGVDCSGVIASEQLRTTTKVRILAGELHSARQQVIRIDYEGEPLNDPPLRAALTNQIRKHAQVADGIIISDYNYGVADAETTATVREIATARELRVLVDSRFRLADFGGCTSATPNEEEVEHLLGRKISEGEGFEAAAAEMRDQLGYQALLVTRGGHGMVLFESGAPPLNVTAVGAREPVDGTGAGDTVIAAYSLALTSDASFPDAARLANYAGGLVVMKRGTASITNDELEHSVLHSELS